MWLLIISPTCFVFGCLAAGYFFKRHQKENERRLEEQMLAREAELQEELHARKEALRKIMYYTHHNGINPIGKRIRGSVNVIRLENPHLQDDYWLSVIEHEALDLETGVLNTIKEFEHLQ